MAFADIGTWDWNIRTGELYWSERIGPLFGYAPGELETTYENFLAAVHPDDRQAVVNAVNACIERRDNYEIEHRVVWPDGSVRWVLERGDVQCDEAGVPSHMLGVVQDITRRREAEHALRESEARFRSLVESTSDWIWEVDPLGRYTYVSPQVEHILGYAPDSLLGKTPFDLMPSSEDLRVRRAFFSLVERRLPINRLVNTNTHVAGYEVILETSGVPFYDGNRRFAGYRGIDRNITLRVAAEKALKEQTLRNRLILENSHDGLVILNLDGSIREVNGAYCRMVGHERNVLLQMTLSDLEVSETDTEAARHIKKISEHGHDHFESSHRCRDGRVIDLDISATLAKVGDDQFIFSFVRDITERRLKEQKRLHEIQAQRDTLVREVHHRIKNHLQGIVNLLRNHIRDKPELAEVMESAIGQVESIALVHGLQSRLNQWRVELPVLLELISKAVGNVASAAVQLEIDEVTPDISVRPSDAVPLALIINELLLNAVKHSGSTMAMRSAIKVNLLVESERVILRVSNFSAVPLPAGFDLQQGIGLGTGLTLARDLLPHRGATLSAAANGDRVTLQLALESPVVRLEQKLDAKDYPTPNRLM
nr:PAS domain S-box protein [Sedimenticola hydrogenitrophicus]